MLRATWKSLWSRKIRLLLSTFAIVLGVAFVAGSLVFTATLDRAFQSIMTGSVSDVVVRPVGSSFAVQPPTVVSADIALSLSLAPGANAQAAIAAVTASLMDYVASLGIGAALTFGLILTLAGLCFKIAAVPAQMWAPDVYQGAPTPTTAFLATGTVSVSTPAPGAMSACHPLCTSTCPCARKSAQ